MKLETLLVHAGGEIDPATGALIPPIHLSTTFEHSPAGETPLGFMYIREDNPTQARLEEALQRIEGGETALVFASGIAAGAAYLQGLPPETHVIFHKDTYYGFIQMAEEYFSQWGLTYSIVDLTDFNQAQLAVQTNTKVLWMETPSNPLLEVLDITRLAAIAHEANAQLFVDGTFATPILQRPLELGADIVLHATTKYLGGHSDVQGGALIFKQHDTAVDKIRRNRLLLGAVASPFNSWLVLRGLRSLACRMERHSVNAMNIAHWLENHPRVDRVHYPGLPSNPGHKIARTQMRAYGGMLSFRVKGDKEDAFQVAARVKLIKNATSLGGVESLIEHRASVEGPNSKVPDNLLRFSVGLESVEDLIEDLKNAFES